MGIGIEPGRKLASEELHKTNVKLPPIGREMHDKEYKAAQLFLSKSLS
jgi:hypothetical protein